MLLYERSESGQVVVPVEVYYKKNSFDEIEALFNKSKKCGLISEKTSFTDNRWIAIANKMEYAIHFRPPNEIQLKKACITSNIQISYDDFLLALKYFTLINLQNIVPSSCSSMLQGINNYFSIFGFIDDVDDFNKEKSIINNYNQLEMFNAYVNFIEFITANQIPEKLLEEIISYGETIEYSSNTRVLPSFKSIFEFGDIMSSFVYNATEKELLKFGPIILWWYIGNRIPLRPSEFVLMNRDCAFEDEGKFFLKIKRNVGKGKGSNLKLINNFKSKDHYITETIQTDKKIYDAICSYNNLVKKFLPDESEREFLFSKNARNLAISGLPKKDALNAEMYTQKNLSELLEQFYTEIVYYKYGIQSQMRDYEKNKKLSNKHKKNEKESRKNKINFSEYESSTHEKLVLYDLRHLAIINLIMLGKEPLGVMKMAGHTQISTTMGYYNHIEEFSKCFSIAYAKHIKALNDNVFNSVSEGEVNLNSLLENTAPTNKALQTWRQITSGQVVRQEYKKVDGGLCSYKYNDFSPCFAVNGLHSICPHFINTGEEIVEKELTKSNKDIESAIDTIKYIAYNFDKISDFSQRYSVITEELKSAIVSTSNIASKFSSIDDVTRILKPLEPRLEE